MLEKMIDIISDQLSVTPGTTITEETSFVRDLHADSFDLMELVMALEEEFGVKVDDEELAKFETVGDVLEYIRTLGVED